MCIVNGLKNNIIKRKYAITNKNESENESEKIISKKWKH